jgi:adenosylhomocysteine nucleosidase
MSHTTIIALIDEAYGLEPYHKIISGVGKINATFAACVAANTGVKKIFNYGSAGAVRDKSLIGKLVKVQYCIQRDMNTVPLTPRGDTPFETDYNSTLTLDADSGITLGTGDSFVTHADPWFEQMNIDCVDMEAYAIAKVCKRLNLEFECYKYITDAADEDAQTNWSDNLHKGAALFEEVLKNV